jgi:NAD(P)-dependent dehydrogenase (short-subunit alcohol dehydrogenase family)
MKSQKRVALVTGGNKGIGFETCRQLGLKGYTVILAARDIAKGESSTQKLKNKNLDVQFLKLDVRSEADADAAYDFVTQNYGRLDALVNNAGVFIDHVGPAEGAEHPIFEADIHDIRESMETNTYGAFRMCQRFVPLMLEAGYGRVVNVSSGMAQLIEMNGGYPGYRISKVGLNAVTKIFADETDGTNVLINSVCPGWVKTDMGGPSAEIEVAEGADSLVWLATLPDGSPSGGFFRERKPIAW